MQIAGCNYPVWLNQGKKRLGNIRKNSRGGFAGGCNSPDCFIKSDFIIKFENPVNLKKRLDYVS